MMNRIIIHKNDSVIEIRKKINTLKKRRKNLKRYLGILKDSKDPIKYQREIRNEWE